MTPSRLSACVAESAALLPSVLLDDQLVHANRLGALVQELVAHRLFEVRVGHAP